MKTVITILALLLTDAATAQVHRCTVDGRNVFSDKPCMDTGETVGDVIKERIIKRRAQAAITRECEVWLATDATVYNSVWDGSVREVEQWLERTAHNPKSVEYITWGQVRRHCDGYAVSVLYRAQNRLGATVAEGRTFNLNRAGLITSTTEIK
jgi:hypothetical protein